MIAALLLAAVVTALPSPAHAHDWYSNRIDPVYMSGCCGGNDCREFDGSIVEAEADGYRIRLTVAQAQAINRNTLLPIDALVPWSRVQPSHDGNWHMCLYLSDRSAPRHGILCFFAPPSM